MRPEIAWPLSVDRNVWDSLFWYRTDTGPYEADWPIRRVAPSTYPHTVLGLWQDFTAMEANGGIELIKVGLPLRVDALSPSPWQEIERWDFLVDFPEPAFGSAEHWRSLGHDICDRGFCSGLANCSYDEERFEWRTRWASKLNEHGLLVEAIDSFEFCRATDTRVSEHAPFFVLELFQPTYWPSRAIV